VVAYLIAFVLAFWPAVGKRPYQYKDMKSIAVEVAALHTTPNKKLRLMNTAAMESGFRRDAVGKAGERGPWQILGGHDFSAKEALRRMDEQGMVAYVGCRHIDDAVVLPGGTRTTCRQMIANRIDRADLYSWVFEPPPDNDVTFMVAGVP